MAAPGGRAVRPGRRLGWTVCGLVLPVVVLGAVLTLSIFGAVFGVPLLVVAAPSFLAARRLVTVGAPEVAVVARQVAFRLAGLALVATASVVAAVALGIDDLDESIDAVWLVVAIAWVAALWWAVWRAQRLALAPPSH